MSNLIPFQFEGRAVRVVEVDGAPWFVAKDVCESLGYADPTTAVRGHCRGVQKLHPIPDALGRTQQARVLAEPDVLRLIVNCTLPTAIEFERLVFEEILPSIRKTGSYTAPNAKPAAKSPALVAAGMIPALVRALRAFGIDKNAAAIGANQIAIAETGANLLAMAGQSQLESETQVLHFTPTELGKTIGMSAIGINKALTVAGLQKRVGDHWAPTDAGLAHALVLDTGKRHSSGSPVEQVKWAESVVSLIVSGVAA